MAKYTTETATRLSNQELVETLMARSRAEGASAQYWTHHPQESKDTPEMVLLRAELLRRLPTEVAQAA